MCKGSGYARLHSSMALYRYLKKADGSLSDSMGPLSRKVPHQFQEKMRKFKLS